MCSQQGEGRPFDWNRMRNDVVLHRQPLTAVYANVNGHVVIRQDGEGYDEDPIVTIAPENLEAVIRAMREQAKMLAYERECIADGRSPEGPPKALPAPENPPASERVNPPASETVVDKAGLFDE